MKQMQTALSLPSVILWLNFCQTLKGFKNNQQLHPEPKPVNKLLLMSFDGFRWDYLSGRANTPNFNALKQGGVHARKGIKNAYLSNTLPNHFSLVTGLYVESHGIVDNFMFDPLMNQTFIPKYFDKNSYNHPDWHNTVGEPIWVSNQIQKENGRSGVIMWMGGETVIKGVRPSRHIPHDDDVLSRVKVDSMIKWFTDLDEPINLGIMYFHQPDIWGHKYGPDSEEVTQMIEELDGVVGYLLHLLNANNLSQTTNVIITSDHGFVPVGKDKVIVLDDIIDTQLYRHASFIPGPVAGIIPNEGNEPIIYEKLKEASKESGHFTVYRKSDIPERFHYKNHRRVPPIFVMAEVGYTFVQNSTQLEEFWLAGNHGYDTDHQEMHPFFMATGPSFKENFSVEEFENVDVYPLMCHLLELRPAPNNGSMAVVSQLLLENMENGTAALSPWLIAALSVGVTLVIICTVLVGKEKLKRN